MFDSSRYTIAWLCGHSAELIAARLHLDREHDAGEYKAARNDNNTYVFGSIGQHDIVIATSSDGGHGTNGPARVARDLIRSFVNVRIGLTVGVGGGAPLMEQAGQQQQQQQQQVRDIRLGDVVVSMPGNGRGGVCQYDYGKVIQGQGFLLTGHLNEPPASLQAVVTVLRTDFGFYGHDIEGSVAAVLATRPQFQKTHGRPDPATDRLYESWFVHPRAGTSCAVTCGDDENLMVSRVSRDQDDESVVVHYGLIASASRIMKDALPRDALAKEHGILCFETEAAGLMNQLPFLVVRGICDYSDTHGNDQWRGYAAMTAAAYARKVLLRLAPGGVGAQAQLSEPEGTNVGVCQGI